MIGSILYGLWQGMLRSVPPHPAKAVVKMHEARRVSRVRYKYSKIFSCGHTETVTTSSNTARMYENYDGSAYIMYECPACQLRTRAAEWAAKCAEEVPDVG